MRSADTLAIVIIIGRDGGVEMTREIRSDIKQYRGFMKSPMVVGMIYRLKEDREQAYLEYEPNESGRIALLLTRAYCDCARACVRVCSWLERALVEGIPSSPEYLQVLQDHRQRLNDEVSERYHKIIQYESSVGTALSLTERAVLLRRFRKNHRARCKAFALVGKWHYLHCVEYRKKQASLESQSQHARIRAVLSLKSRQQHDDTEAIGQQLQQALEQRKHHGAALAPAAQQQAHRHKLDPVWKNVFR